MKTKATSGVKSQGRGKSAGHRKTRGPSADEVFANEETNSFLVALENWIARKLPQAPEISEDALEKLLAKLDRVAKEAAKPGADAGKIFGQMSQALGDGMPAPEAPDETGLNRYERLFRAVYYFESDTYNDGVETYLAAHDEAELRLALEGLTLIDASEMRTRLEALCRAVFGSTHPATEKKREALLEAAGRAQAALFKEFATYHARTSAELDEALARWARANRAHFSSSPAGSPR